MPIVVFVRKNIWYKTILVCINGLCFIFLNMGQSGPLLFIFFLCTAQIKFKLKKQSINILLGTRTRGRRMVGKDRTTELWRPPYVSIFFYRKKSSLLPKLARWTRPSLRNVRTWLTWPTSTMHRSSTIWRSVSRPSSSTPVRYFPTIFIKHILKDNWDAVLLVHYFIWKITKLFINLVLLLPKLIVKWMCWHYLLERAILHKLWY